MSADTPTPTIEEKIRARAHAIWEREGRPEGQDLAHWQQAESEIAAEGEPQAEAPGEAAAKAPRRRAAAAAGRTRRKEAAE
jgi:hypothetical protein